MFARLDDVDVMAAIKDWAYAEDPILQYLCSGLLQRRLFKLQFARKAKAEAILEEQSERLLSSGKWAREDLPFLLTRDSVSNTAYQLEKDHILILMKSGEVVHISDMEEQVGLRALAGPVEKWYVCYPQNEML